MRTDKRLEVQVPLSVPKTILYRVLCSSFNMMYKVVTMVTKNETTEALTTYEERRKLARERQEKVRERQEERRTKRADKRRQYY